MTPKQTRDALVTEMREYADTSDGCQYGTISTRLLRDFADRLAALPVGDGEPVAWRFKDAKPRWPSWERSPMFTEWRYSDGEPTLFDVIKEPLYAAAPPALPVGVAEPVTLDMVIQKNLPSIRCFHPDGRQVEFVRRDLMPPAAVPAGFKLLGYANAFRIKQTCADKPGGAHLGQVAIYAGESVDPMEIQERENPTHMGEPLLGHGWKPIGSAPRTPDAWFLAWHPDTGCGLTFWNAGKFYSYAPDDPPTHWMPLPARPDAPAGEKGT